MPSSWAFALVAAGLFLATAAGAAAQSWQADFEGPFQAVAETPGRPSRITGEIAPPFGENSSGWADVDMRFSRLTEEPFAGAAALRCEVTAVREGRAQMWIPGIQPPVGKYAKLRVALRAPASGSLEIGLRQSGPPWQHPWQKSYLLSPEWRVVEEILPPGALTESAIRAIIGVRLLTQCAVSRWPRDRCAGPWLRFPPFPSVLPAGPLAVHSPILW